jgi:hypothetical protein
MIVGRWKKKVGWYISGIAHVAVVLGVRKNGPVKKVTKVTGDKGVFSIDTIENAVVFSTTKRGGEW